MGELRGLISIDELEALVASDEVDTVVTVHRPLREGPWEALHRTPFPRRDLRARDTRLRLPAHSRHGDGAGAGLHLRQLGSGVRGLPHGA